MGLVADGRNARQYTCGDVVKHWSFSPALNGVELSPLVAVASERISSAKSYATVQVFFLTYGLVFHLHFL